MEALGSSLAEVLADQEAIDRLIEDGLLDVRRLKKSADPIRAKRRVREAIAILSDLRLPREEQNERSALTLLALLDLPPKSHWSKASNPTRGVSDMMEFFTEHYGKVYAPHTRESIRRQTVHQFVRVGVALRNPDGPRPVASSKASYQIASHALALLRTFGTVEWEKRLQIYATGVRSPQHGLTASSRQTVWPSGHPLRHRADQARADDRKMPRRRCSTRRKLRPKAAR